MNMKKTIAAIAAGAVAVSAMATTVSALEATTLTYNLVKTIKEDNKGVGTITATFTNVPLEAGGTLTVDTKYGHGWDTMVTVSGSFWDDEAGTNKSFVPVVATQMDWETGYSIEGKDLWNDTKVIIPVVAGTAQGTATALKASSSAVITVTVKYTSLKNDVSWAGDINGLLKDGVIGIQITSKGSAAEGSEAKNVTATYMGVGGTKAMSVTVLNQDALNRLSGLSLAYDATNGQWKTAASNTSTFKVTAAHIADGNISNPAAINVTAVAGFNGGTVASGTYNLTLTGATTATDPMGNTWTVAAVGGVTLAANDTCTVEYKAGDAISAGVDKTADVAAALSFMNLVAANDTLTFSIYQPAGAGADGVKYISTWAGAGVDATAGNSEKKYPYRSSLTNSLWVDEDSTAYGDVIDWIAYANSSNDKERYEVYNAVKAVINDCIQNYGDVVFTFNTATEKVKDGVYDKDGTDYTQFGKHFWDKSTGYAVDTIYIKNDWVGNNLFEGALIINNNLTLSLGATDKFDWTSTSLSFSWDAIQDAALTQNQYANYIQNMILRTSTVWYWDNMTVSLGATDTDEVDSGAPVEANDEDLPEEEETDVDFGEEEEEEEEETEAEPEPEVAPVETATNPGTGNAPVALAVIPVALAAAAIVAKKRG